MIALASAAVLIATLLAVLTLSSPAMRRPALGDFTRGDVPPLALFFMTAAAASRCARQARHTGEAQP